MTSKQTPFGTLTYTYDATSNRTSTQSSNANGLSVSYGYDALNRLQTVTDNRLALGVTNYTYDEVSNLARTTQPNGVQHDYSYNSVDLLTQLNVSKGAGTLARYKYTHTATRLRASMTELNGRTVNYTYDEAYQLVGETITNAPQAAQNGVIGYVLDAVGNRTQRNSTLPAISTTANTYDAVDRLNTDSYDANGNTIAADGKTFSYDFRDKLKSVNGGAITIKYDGDGNRVSKTVGGVTTNYLVDTNNPSGYAQVVEEMVGGQVQRAYTYGTMLISQRQLVGGSWVTSHYGYDGSVNVRLLTDSTGTLTDTFDYDAFGNLIGRTGTTANRYLYRGQQFDADIGFYHQRTRYYSQQRGRFLTVDTFDGIQTEPRSLHKYLYAYADPVKNDDPSGLLTTASSAIIRTHELAALDSLEELAVEANCTIYKLGSVISFNIADLVPLTYCAVRFNDPDYFPDWFPTPPPPPNTIPDPKDEPKKRGFWSGGIPAREAARTWALANNGLTLEMTPEGIIVEIVTAKMDWTQAKELWVWVSTRFAAGAEGEAHAFLRSDEDRLPKFAPNIKPDSVWIEHELPTLEKIQKSVELSLTQCGNK